MARALCASVHARGFTLIEVLVALAILVIAALATVQVLVVAAAAMHDARVHTSTAILAAQRMEQLLALDWDAAGLAPSPSDTLEADVEGYIDYLDGAGTTLGTSVTPPAAAAFVRRWAVDPYSSGRETIVIRVLVRSLAADAGGRRGSWGEARLVTLRTRVAR